MSDRPRWGPAWGGGPRARPPWWPEGEPFPPARPWPGRRGHLARRAGLVLLVLFGLVFATSALAVALVSVALGIGDHRGLGVLATILGLGLMIGAIAAVGRAVRRTAVPLEEVMEAADRVAAGHYEARVAPDRGFPQMRRLARSFNAMAERLRAGEEHRRNLLADVTHELRTPLSVIQGNAEGILDGLYPADRSHVEPILEETRVMARLLDDLQTLSTAQAGALRLHPEPCRPADLAEEADRKSVV